MRRIQNSVLRHSVVVCLTIASLAVNSRASADCPDPANTSNTCLGVGALESNTEGIFNTAIGLLALRENTIGSDNTAIGRYALIGNTTGIRNTASGAAALSSNTTGTFNTANGHSALELNSTGRFNAAFGSEALQRNTVGERNTALGMAALTDNSTGRENTATGFFALRFNLTGNFNTATGVEALYGGFITSEDPASGSSNTANGYRAIYSNDTGSDNTATGVNALYSNTTGNQNTAAGTGALKHSVSGYRNVALGYQAGYNVTTGSDNIMIGGGNNGKAIDNGVIRLGNSTYQRKTFIAGIRGVTTGLSAATAVFIDANGQLGTIKSSREFKEDILPMGSVSERLLALRPVTFRYRKPDEDGNRPVQFGLVAEEVAEAFPELVVYDEQGKPETVRYDLIATMLLNEFQKERSATQVALAQLRTEVARMEENIERLDQAKMVSTTQ